MYELTTDINVNNFTIEYQKLFYEYWLELKGDKFLPDRKDFNPAKVRDALQSMLMMDVHYDPLRFKIRLFGTEIVKYRGRDITGTWVHEFDNNEKLTERLEGLIAEPLPYYVQEDLSWMGKRHVAYSALVLPFSADGENVNIIMGSNHFF